MNTNAASLDCLHDIIMPAPVPWWPPAPGWYWLIGFAVSILSAVLLRGFIHWQHNRYRREVLAEFARLKGRLKHSTECDAVLFSMAELLKRTALTAFPREHVASLTGNDWHEFLDQTGSCTAFGGGLGSILENAVYDPRTVGALPEQKIQELTRAIHRWIRNHRSGNERKEAKPTTNGAAHTSLLPSLPPVERPTL